MTQEQYNKSIETGELQLSVWGKISYYFLVVLLLLIPLMFLVFDLFDTSRNFVSPPIGAIIIPIILGVLLYIYQRMGLKLQIIETKLTKNDLLRIAKQLCDEQHGVIVSHEGNILIAKTDISSTSRKSKKITILFDKNKVFVNSIYDPDLNKSSIDLVGSNKEIINILIDHIQKADKQPE